jgi:hypothetical protein
LPNPTATPQAFKGFTRIHVTPTGDLEIWTLGADRIPTAWREDPRWAGPSGGGDRRGPAHAAAAPSRWLPAGEASALRRALARAASTARGGKKGAGGGGSGAAAAAAAARVLDPSQGFRVVDVVFVPKKRPGAA